MTQIIKQRNLKSITWEIKEAVNFEQVKSVSVNFTFQNRKCYFTYDYSTRHAERLYFESDEKLNKVISILLSIDGASGNICLKRSNVNGEKQEIWSNSGTRYDLENCRLTFEVIFCEEISEEIEPEVAPEEQIPSYLENSIHLQALSRDLSKLLDDESNIDVVITCKGKEIHAHRAVLQSRCPVLSAKLIPNRNGRGKANLVYYAEGIKFPIFKSFLRYLYNGILPELSMHIASKMYEVAVRYDVGELKIACTEFMIKNLSDRNACATLAVADVHNDDDFREKVISYIIDRDIPDSTFQWDNFHACFPRLGNKVLTRYLEEKYGT